MSKILVFSSEFPPEPGGIGNHAFGLAKELTKHYNVFVLSEFRGFKDNVDQFISINCIKINVYLVKRYRISFFTYLKRLKLLFVLQKKVDVIFFSGKFQILSLFFTRSSINRIAIIHGSEIKQKYLLKYIFLKSLYRANHIVAVSNFTKNRLCEYYKINPNKVTVINNGFIQSKDLIKAGINSLECINLITVG